MYWFDVDKHKSPHFHVRYQGTEWVYDFKGSLLAGNINPRVDHLIKEWCSIRSDELETAWQRAIKGEPLPWIAPLN